MTKHFLLDDMPPRLTLMQAVAWIATRDPVVVLRASMDEGTCARAMSEVGKESEWCGTEVGLSLISIDLRCANDIASQEAADALIEALRNGRIKAKGSYFSIKDGWGQICLLPDEIWDPISLETEADNDRNLVPFVRRGDGGVVVGPVREWRVIGIASADMIRHWPAQDIAEPGCTASTLVGDNPGAPATASLAAKQRGRKPAARTAVKARMLAALSAGHITPEQLATDTEESLVIAYGGGHKRDTCRTARVAALSHFTANSPPNK